MTTASPTPFASTSFQSARLHRNPPARQLSRSYTARAATRRHSPISTSAHSHGFSANAAPIQNISYGDSSDDEIPQPMNFSALTRALLEEKPTAREQSPYMGQWGVQQRHPSPEVEQGRSAATPGSRLRISRHSSPLGFDQDHSSTPPRVVYLSGSKHSSGLRRSKSAAVLSQERGSAKGTPHELITPAPRSRQPLRPRVNSATSVGGEIASVAEADDPPHAHLSSGYHTSGDAILASNHDSSNKTRHRAAAEAMPGSLRVKRVPVGSGTFLRGAPVRRALRRRNSDDDEGDNNGLLGASQNNGSTPDDHEAHSAPTDGRLRSSEIHEARNPLDDRENIPNQHQQHSSTEASYSSNRPYKPPLISNIEANTANPQSTRSSAQSEKAEAPQQLPQMFKVPSLPLSMPSAHDQENEPPPTFKRNKAQNSGMLGALEKVSALPVDKDRPVHDMRSASPQRPVLAPRSLNTPHRAAPPPPKMTVLETATATGGASTVKSKKKRSHITVNGKMFTLMGKIGKGGSSDVYRVMAENYRIFALKKVNLEDINEDAVRGYKGEIELLKRLENVDRVVRLLDWEVNEQKQSLSVLMEMGESDLNRVLSLRLHPENARFDISFTRHYWKEMLECVLAVHQQDIVHSDLKPANFLLVQGRLKLIDFGISNAIDIDNTVNVHRETNVGTPNYMSPESLQDTNHLQRGAVGPNGAPLGKLMKLGKPSDVWSLGCILYQMVYGKPPFAHIANQYQRIMAIINPAVVVDYPLTGVGGAPVPSSLRRTLRRCLNRDFSQRPTVEQLLDEGDAFLSPDIDNEGAIAMTEELLGQILAKVVDRCRDPKRGPPSDAELATYPKGFFGKIRGRLEEV